MRLKHILTFIFTAFMGIFAFAADSAVNATDWEHYSSFHANPRRIMDGERYTYFFVYQNKYSYTSYSEVTFGSPSGTILFYDKQNPNLGIRSIYEKVLIHDARVCIADYNPRTGKMVLVYDDNSIELLGDNGQSVIIEELSSRPGTERYQPRNISWDLYNDIWIGLNRGFIYINGETGQVIKAPDYTVPVNWICRVGERVVAFMANEIYDADFNDDLNDVHAFNKTGMSVGRIPHCVMPVGDKAFAFLSALGAYYDAAINLAKFNGEKWSSSTVPGTSDNISFTGFASGSFYSNYLENNCIINRDGYLLFNKDYIYQVNIGLSDVGGLSFKKRKLLTSNQVAYGSYDFETFWYYNEPGRFSMKKANDEYVNDTKWSSVGTEISPNVARAHNNVNFIDTDNFGMLSLNCGRSLRFNYSGNLINPTQLSGYANGKWTDYSPAYVRPAFLDDGTAYTGFNRAWYPVPDPYTPVQDPVFPDYVFFGSFYDGLAAINLAQPKKAALHWGEPNSRSKGIPNFKAFFPATTWTYVCPVKVAGFDADGTLWILYSQYWGKEEPKQMRYFYYLTADARREALESQDITKCGEWGVLPTSQISSTCMDEALVLKHPNNKNKLISFCANNAREVAIYDHKGTLNDSSDDTEIAFANVLNPNGGHRKFDRVNSFTEDPITGDIYISYFGGVDVINPNDALVGGAMPATPLYVKGPGGNRKYIAGASNVAKVAVDEYGRLWVATFTDGLILINAARTEVIATFRTSNSELPSDCINDVSWSSSQKRVFVSTNKGIVSFRVDGDAESTSDILKAYPASVDENYGGTIAVYNVSGISALKVRNSKNSIVAELPAPVDNITYWNLLDDSGKSVPSGRYTIYDTNGYSTPVEITVSRH